MVGVFVFVGEDVMVPGVVGVGVCVMVGTLISDGDSDRMGKFVGRIRMF